MFPAISCMTWPTPYNGLGRASRAYFFRTSTLAVMSVSAWRHIMACSLEHAGKLCTCTPKHMSTLSISIPSCDVAVYLIFHGHEGQSITTTLV